MATLTTAHDPHHGVGHVVPLRILFSVFAALLFFTFTTVAITWINLGKLALPCALAIALIKATLVVLYFMHLRYDKPFNSIIFVGSLLFVCLFIGLSLYDTQNNQPSVNTGVAPDYLKAHPAK